MQSDDYQVSRVVVYECVNGGRKQKPCCLFELNVLDQDFKRCLDRSENLRQAYKRSMDSQHQIETDCVAELFIEFGLRNRARFAIEQKIELAKCCRTILTEVKSDALAQANAELDYISGLLDSFNSPGLSVLQNSVNQVRHYQLNELENIDNDVHSIHIIPNT